MTEINTGTRPKAVREARALVAQAYRDLMGNHTLEGYRRATEALAAATHYLEEIEKESA
jgi:hypothetical protein